MPFNFPFGSLDIILIILCICVFMLIQVSDVEVLPTAVLVTSDSDRNLIQNSQRSGSDIIITDAILVDKKLWYKKWQFWVVLLLFSLLIAIIIILTTRNKGGNKDSLRRSPPPSSFTSMPSLIPSNQPSLHPSQIPSHIPSGLPTIIPSGLPTIIPSDFPTTIPSGFPTNMPSYQPSISAKPTKIGERLQNTGLTRIFIATFGGSWNNNTNWITEESVCTWYGVSCGDSESIQVTSLNMKGNNVKVFNSTLFNIGLLNLQSF